LLRVYVCSIRLRIHEMVTHRAPRGEYGLLNLSGIGADLRPAIRRNDVRRSRLGVLKRREERPELQPWGEGGMRCHGAKAQGPFVPHSPCALQGRFASQIRRNVVRRSRPGVLKRREERPELQPWGEGGLRFRGAKAQGPFVPHSPCALQGRFASLIRRHPHHATSPSLSSFMMAVMRSPKSWFMRPRPPWASKGV